MGGQATLGRPDPPATDQAMKRTKMYRVYRLLANAFGWIEECVGGIRSRLSYRAEQEWLKTVPNPRGLCNLCGEPWGNAIGQADYCCPVCDPDPNAANFCIMDRETHARWLRNHPPENGDLHES